MHCEPWWWRTARPRATSFANPPKWRRTPWRSGSRASERVAAGEAWMPAHPRAPGVAGTEPGRLALAGDGRGQVGAPHGVDRLGDDGAVVAARPARRADARGGEQ